MGKGDIKSKKGKRWVGSYGKKRPKKKGATGSQQEAAKND
jgi:ribosomal small subunit protein bTHX